MTQADMITLRLGLPSEQRRAAAALYYEAFRTKLTPFLGAAGRLRCSMCCAGRGRR